MAAFPPHTSLCLHILSYVKQYDHMTHESIKCWWGILVFFLSFLLSFSFLISHSQNRREKRGKKKKKKSYILHVLQGKTHCTLIKGPSITNFHLRQELTFIGLFQMFVCSLEEGLRYKRATSKESNITRPILHYTTFYVLSKSHNFIYD